MNTVINKTLVDNNTWCRTRSIILRHYKFGHGTFARTQLIHVLVTIDQIMRLDLDLVWPNGILVEGNWVYWADASTDKFGRINRNTGENEDVMPDHLPSHPFAMVVNDVTLSLSHDERINCYNFSSGILIFQR